MLIDDLKFKFGDYKNTPKSKTNKALHQKIKIIPTDSAFTQAMYKIGVTQTKKQYATLITDACEFNINNYTKNNSFKLNNDNVIFNDFIDESKFEIPVNTQVDVYTKTIRLLNRRYLEVVYLLNGEVFVINERG